MHPPPEKQSGRLSAKSGKKSDGPNSHMRQVCSIEEISVSHARHASTLKFWMKWTESQEKIYNFHKLTQEERESWRSPVISGEIPSLIKTKSSPKANSRPTGFKSLRDLRNVLQLRTNYSTGSTKTTTCFSLGEHNPHTQNLFKAVFTREDSGPSHP